MHHTVIFMIQMYLFPIAIITNYQKCNGFKQQSLFLQSQKSEAENRSKHCAPYGGSRRSSVFLPFLISRVQLYSLSYDSFLHFQSLFSPLTCLPLMRIQWLHQDHPGNPGKYVCLKTFNLINIGKFSFPCKVTCLQIPGIRAWTTSWSHYSVYHNIF